MEFTGGVGNSPEEHEIHRRSGELTGGAGNSPEVRENHHRLGVLLAGAGVCGGDEDGRVLRACDGADGAGALQAAQTPR
eukprot:3692677-Pyramimonas_sp.AAC.2